MAQPAWQLATAPGCACLSDAAVHRYLQYTGGGWCVLPMRRAMLGTGTGSRRQTHGAAPQARSGMGMADGLSHGAA